VLQLIARRDWLGRGSMLVLIQGGGDGKALLCRCDGLGRDRKQFQLPLIMNARDKL